MSDKEVKMNIACRKAAHALLNLGQETVESEGLDPERFWVAVAAVASDRAGLVTSVADPDIAPMTDEQSRAFERQSMTFGKYEGKPINAVPVSYLLWLDSGLAYWKELHRYLASKRVQSEQADEE